MGSQQHEVCLITTTVIVNGVYLMFNDWLDYGVHVSLTSSQLTSLYEMLQALLDVLLVQISTLTHQLL